MRFDDLLDETPDPVASKPGGPSALPTVISAGDLAALLGVTAKRVAELSRDGVIPKAGRNRYEPTEAIPAFIEYARKNPIGRPRTASAEKDRLTAAQADLAEIKLAQARGDLLPASEVRTRWISYTAALRAALLAVPPRLTARLGLDRKAAADLDAEMRAALDQIAEEGQEVTE